MIEKKYITVRELLQRLQKRDPQLNLFDLYLELPSSGFNVYFYAPSAWTVRVSLDDEDQEFIHGELQGGYFEADGQRISGETKDRLEAMVYRVKQGNFRGVIPAELSYGVPVEGAADPFLLEFTQVQPTGYVLSMTENWETRHDLLSNRAADLLEDPTQFLPFGDPASYIVAGASLDPVVVDSNQLMISMDDALELEGSRNLRAHHLNHASYSPEAISDLPAGFQALYEAVSAEQLPDIDLLITAWQRHWKGRTEKDGKPYPRNSDVVEWIKDQMDDKNFSNNKAEAMASIIRPEWASKGGRPKSSS